MTYQKASSEEIEKLRDISICDILGLRNTGRRQMIRCPFHDDSTPSFCIFPDNGFKCFGCDKKGAGAISFLMAGGATFTEAIEELRTFKP